MLQSIANMNAQVPQNINRIIDEKGLKKCAVARKIGVDTSEFYNMLSGRKLIKLCYIRPIADAIGVTPNDLFGMGDKKAPG